MGRGGKTEWAKTTLGEAADYLNGRAFKSAEWEKTGRPIIRIQNLNDRTAPFNRTQGSFEQRYAVVDGDLLFAWSASLGAHIWRGEPAWLNQHIFKVVPAPGVDKKFLYYFLQRVIAELYAEAHGSGMVHVTKSNFTATPFFLPPEPEQRRIVAKIEELFSELDKGVESLTTARAQLKTYRQALLKHAFEGRLTEQWRRERADELESADELLTRIRKERAARYRQQLEYWKAEVARWEADGKPGKKPRKPTAPRRAEDLAVSDLAALPELPSNWKWAPLSWLAGASGGLMKGRQPNGAEQKELPYLRVANVQAGWLDLAEVKVIRVPVDEIEKYKMISGDVLYIEGGDKDKVGRGAVWKGEIQNCVHQNHVFKARPESGIDSKYLSLFSQTETARGYFFANAKQTVNLASISLRTLSGLPVPVCSHDEQRELVSQLEARLSQIEQLEETIDTALKQAEALRQSILKRAFEGRLVPQDPNDEPAAELLGRIRAERQAQPTGRRANGRKKLEA